MECLGTPSDSSDPEWQPAVEDPSPKRRRSQPSRTRSKGKAVPTSSSFDAPEFQELYTSDIAVGSFVVVHVEDDKGRSGVDVGQVGKRIARR